jgi:hypothetical protein
MSTMNHQWIFMDPYSAQLATLDAERKTWFIRKLPLGDTHGQTVLLNWPDTVVPVGTSFHFEPRLAGGEEFSAEVFHNAGLITVNKAAHSVDFPFDAGGLNTVRLVNLTTVCSNGGDITYPILIHAAGPAWPYISHQSKNVYDATDRGVTGASLSQPEDGCLPVPATFIDLPDTVKSIVGMAAAHVVLLTDAGKAEFLSIASRTIAGSIPIAEKASYFVGAGALFEYDPDLRTLTRIGIPEGRRECVLHFPPDIDLRGIGIGPDATSPVTLMICVARKQQVAAAQGTPLEFEQGFSHEEAQKFAGLTIDPAPDGWVPMDDNRAAVLDSRTLNGSNILQPVSLSRLLGQGPDQNGLSNDPNAQGQIMQFPASHSGLMVQLTSGIVIMGESSSIYYPTFQFGSDVQNFLKRGPYALGAGWQNGGYSSLGITTAEAISPLSGPFVMGIFRIPFITSNVSPPPTAESVRLLGDYGPLVVVSNSRRCLELIDLNLPAAAAAAAPQDFQVVSQPLPYVTQGETFQYQLRVNNPAAVAGFSLRQPLPGATISAQGLFTCPAPTRIVGPTVTRITIDLKAKSGQSLTHQFPIFVLPMPAAGSQGTPGELVHGI